MRQRNDSMMTATVVRDSPHFQPVRPSRTKTTDPAQVSAMRKKVARIALSDRFSEKRLAR